MPDSDPQPFDSGDIGIPDLDLNMDAFDLSGVDADLGLSDVVPSVGEPKPKIETRYVAPPAFIGTRAHAVRYDNADDFAYECGGRIMDGQRIDALLSGNFIFGDFIEALAVRGNLLVDDITLSTLSMSRENVDSLENLIVGDFLQTLNIIVSDFWFSHNRQNVEYIYEHLDHDNCFQLAVAGTHTKITLLRVGDQKIVMQGSANLRSSRSLEVVTVETNSELYDFHRKWHDTILKHYATINKDVAPEAAETNALRASSLYDKIGDDKSPRES